MRPSHQSVLCTAAASRCPAATGDKPPASCNSLQTFEQDGRLALARGRCRCGLAHRGALPEPQSTLAANSLQSQWAAAPTVVPLVRCATASGHLQLVQAGPHALATLRAVVLFFRPLLIKSQPRGVPAIQFAPSGLDNPRWCLRVISSDTPLLSLCGQLRARGLR
jgi:hypothetical protein